MILRHFTKTLDVDGILEETPVFFLNSIKTIQHLISTKQRFEKCKPWNYNYKQSDWSWIDHIIHSHTISNPNPKCIQMYCHSAQVDPFQQQGLGGVNRNVAFEWIGRFATLQFFSTPVHFWCATSKSSTLAKDCSLFLQLIAGSSEAAAMLFRLAPFHQV